MSYFIKIKVTRVSKDQPFFGYYANNLPEDSPVRKAFIAMRDARTAKHIPETTKFSTDGLTMNMTIDYGTEAVYRELQEQVSDDAAIVKAARDAYELANNQTREIEINSI